MKKVLQFIKDWMLPLAIITGISLYLLIRFLPVLDAIEPGFSKFAENIQPTLVALILFLQFNRISPHDLRSTAGISAFCWYKRFCSRFSP